MFKSLISKIKGEKLETKGLNSFFVQDGSSGNIIPISKAQLLHQNKSFVYTCAKITSQNCAVVPLRLYSTSKTNQKQIQNFESKAISKNQARYLEKTRVSVLRQSERVVEVLDHPMLDLLYDVNMDSNMFDNFQLTYNYMDLAGNCYWYIVRDGSGLPETIFQLKPDMIEVVPDKQTGFIKGYLYNHRKVALEREDVIRFNVPNPNSKWYGLSIVEAMSSAVKRYNSADQFEAGRLQNSARPDFVVQYKQELDVAQIRELDLAWKKAINGPKNAGRVKIMGSDFEIKTLDGLSSQEMQYLQGRIMTMKEISSAFGIPYSIIDTTESKKAGLDMTEKLFQKNAVVPRLRIVEDVLNEQLVPMYDDTGSLFLAFDDPVKEDKEFNLKLEESRIKSGVITVEEVREAAGLN